MIILGQFVEKLASPIGLVFILLILAVVLRRRKGLGTTVLLSAFIVFTMAGNGWFVHWAVRSLERRHLTPEPLPNADVILLLSGGLGAKDYPRATLEVGEAGDRLLYAAHLYREHKAPVILCTGGIVPGSTRQTAISDDMRLFLALLQIPDRAILVEDKSRNTREHAENCRAILEQRGAARVLLVTSALHMPRGLGVFRKYCPELQFIPAPTDFLSVDPVKPPPWWKEISKVIPTAANLATGSAVWHEYVGLLYYRIRGWV